MDATRQQEQFWAESDIRKRPPVWLKPEQEKQLPLQESIKLFRNFFPAGEKKKNSWAGERGREGANSCFCGKKSNNQTKFYPWKESKRLSRLQLWYVHLPKGSRATPSKKPHSQNQEHQTSWNLRLNQDKRMPSCPHTRLLCADYVAVHLWDERYGDLPILMWKHTGQV